MPIIGYLDDFYILKMACSHTFNSLRNAGNANDEIKQKAKIKIHEYFQDFDESFIDEV